MGSRNDNVTRDVFRRSRHSTRGATSSQAPFHAPVIEKLAHHHGGERVAAEVDLGFAGVAGLEVGGEAAVHREIRFDLEIAAARLGFRASR